MLNARSPRFLTLSFLLFSGCFLAAAQTGLSNGTPVNGTLGPKGSATYTFSGEAGAYYRGSFNGQDDGFRRIFFSMTSPCGNAGANGNFYGNFSAAGTCSVTLSRSDSNSGNVPYQLDVVVVSPGTPAMPPGGMMSNGVPYNDSVKPGQLSVWQFNTAYADTPTLTLTPGHETVDLDYIFSTGRAADSCGTTNGITTCQCPHNTGTWSVIIYINGNDTSNDAPQNYTLTMTGATLAPPPYAGKDNGKCPVCLASAGSNGMPWAGDPISIGNGNLFESFTDYTTAGANPLAFIRYYNSLGNKESTPLATPLGVNWRSNFDRYLHIVSATAVNAERPDGRILPFAYNGTAWVTDSDVDVTLTQSGSSWTLIDNDDTTETYTTYSSTEALLDAIKTRNGYTQTLSYSGALLNSVTDSYGRRLSLYYTGELLSSVTTPDALTLSYGYGAAGGLSVLTSVGYNTTPATRQTYLYENASFPAALTGITDENGHRFATWSYETKGRAASSQRAGGADYTQVSYDDSTGNRTVTGPLGLQETYVMETLQNVAKVKEIDRAANGTVAAAARYFTYDSRGYLSTASDYGGNYTQYVNNAHGQPTTIYEGYPASGSPVLRTTTIAYDTTWVHLPKTITHDILTESFTYEAGTGNMLTRTLTDHASGAGTYTPATRTWTYSWSNFLLATVQNPRTDLTAAQRLTAYAHDASGALTGITNGLAQTTKITAHTPGGRPLTIVDPNGVTTTLTYDTRQHLKTRAVSTAGGARTSIFGYDAAENLISVQLPGGATLTSTFDNAHRLTKVTDLLAQTINYTLDAAGNVTAATRDNSAETTKWSHGSSFDAAGRMLTDTGGAGQKWQYGHDAQGNVTSTIDPMANPATAEVYDRLNRLIQVTDRAGGVTKYTLEPTFGWITKVVTPNGAATSYFFNGFGDMIEEISPDRGTTYYYYDQAGNLTQKKDALSVITNYTNDALDRRLTVSYPAAPAENVAYAYDQAGHGFGIGRLTSSTDPAGSYSRSYDERGNITAESHTHGTHTLTNGYGYDPAGLLTTLTYPDGMVLTQARDTMERITGLSLKPTSGGTSQTVLGSITYQPFGPVSGFSYGNGVTDSRTLDGDYRVTNVIDSNSLQNLTYALNANDNVTGITDAIMSANSQKLTYDALDRLKTAIGAYGSESFTYDPNGNRNSYNGTSWMYTANSNRLTAMGTTTVTSNANGSITNVAYARAMGLTYFKSGRLASVTSGGSTVLSYLYDGFGHRVTKTDTAQHFEQYDQLGRYIEETDNTFTTKLDYIYLDGMPVATFVPNGSTGTLSFLHTDRLGTPRLATNASKAIGWNGTTSDPFNAPNTVSGNTIANNLRLPGQEYELGGGFNHNGWRDYAPGLGRYLESDPIGLAGGINTYAYVESNPHTFVDFDGLQAMVGPYLPIPPSSYPGGFRPYSPIPQNVGSSGFDPNAVATALTRIFNPTSIFLNTNPPTDASDPNGAKAPGKPGKAEGFCGPKGGDNWVPNPNGSGSGWEDENGNVWVPTGWSGARGTGTTGPAHGGPHWDVQDPKTGKSKNVRPIVRPTKE